MGAAAMYGGGLAAGSAATAVGMNEYMPDFNNKREPGKKPSSFGSGSNSRKKEEQKNIREAAEMRNKMENRGMVMPRDNLVAYPTAAIMTNELNN